GRAVLIAGGGEKALQKLRLLSKTSAHIKVIAEDVTIETTREAESAGAQLLPRRFLAADVEGAALVFAANDDPERDAEVIAAAKALGIPHNLVDGPSESSFIMPAIVDRDPVVVAVGTVGA